ncbi:unnamed protein product [Rotaria sordida]|uniref:Uncharacterized protein n=1 Tax=Rotaria sordida TaxID=392033 RepID=A0A814KDF0_9BILA|nr:unnamed protein product [Rotaria sordida]CAF1050984.1 unnamed protein product [Rotaria sordida]
MEIFTDYYHLSSTNHYSQSNHDFKSVEELRQLKPTWNFFTINKTNHHGTNIINHFQPNFNHLSSEIKLNETRLLMCELQMLIDFQYVLCCMFSNVSRLVQILRHQHRTTTISLDRPWYAT